MILFQVMGTRRYNIRGAVFSNDRHKQTPLRGPAPQNPTAPGVIRVPNPEVNLVDNEGGNIIPETQPEETLNQVNVTQQTHNDASNVGKKGGRKGKEEQTLPPK